MGKTLHNRIRLKRRLSLLTLIVDALRSFAMARGAR